MHRRQGLAVLAVTVCSAVFVLVYYNSLRGYGDFAFMYANSNDEWSPPSQIADLVGVEIPKPILKVVSPSESWLDNPESLEGKDFPETCRIHYSMSARRMFRSVLHVWNILSSQPDECVVVAWFDAADKDEMERQGLPTSMQFLKEMFPGRLLVEAAVLEHLIEAVEVRLHKFLKRMVWFERERDIAIQAVYRQLRRGFHLDRDALFIGDVTTVLEEGSFLSHKFILISNSVGVARLGGATFHATICLCSAAYLHMEQQGLAQVTLGTPGQFDPCGEDPSLCVSDTQEAPSTFSFPEDTLTYYRRDEYPRAILYRRSSFYQMLVRAAGGEHPPNELFLVVDAPKHTVAAWWMASRRYITNIIDGIEKSNLEASGSDVALVAIVSPENVSEMKQRLSAMRSNSSHALSSAKIVAVTCRMTKNELQGIDGIDDVVVVSPRDKLFKLPLWVSENCAALRPWILRLVLHRLVRFAYLISDRPSGVSELADASWYERRRYIVVGRRTPNNEAGGAYEHVPLCLGRKCVRNGISVSSHLGGWRRSKKPLEILNMWLVCMLSPSCSGIKGNVPHAAVRSADDYSDGVLSAIAARAVGTPGSQVPKSSMLDLTEYLPLECKKTGFFTDDPLCELKRVAGSSAWEGHVMSSGEKLESVRSMAVVIPVCPENYGAAYDLLKTIQQWPAYIEKKSPQVFVLVSGLYSGQISLIKALSSQIFIVDPAELRMVGERSCVFLEAMLPLLLIRVLAARRIIWLVRPELADVRPSLGHRLAYAGVQTGLLASDLPRKRACNLLHSYSGLSESLRGACLADDDARSYGEALLSLDSIILSNDPRVISVLRGLMACARRVASKMQDWVSMRNWNTVAFNALVAAGMRDQSLSVGVFGRRRTPLDMILDGSAVVSDASKEPLIHWAGLESELRQLKACERYDEWGPESRTEAGRKLIIYGWYGLLTNNQLEMGMALNMAKHFNADIEILGIRNYMESISLTSQWSLMYDVDALNQFVGAPDCRVNIGQYGIEDFDYWPSTCRIYPPCHAFFGNRSPNRRWAVSFERQVSVFKDPVVASKPVFEISGQGMFDTYWQRKDFPWGQTFEPELPYRQWIYDAADYIESYVLHRNGHKKDQMDLCAHVRQGDFTAEPWGLPLSVFIDALLQVISMGGIETVFIGTNARGAQREEILKHIPNAVIGCPREDVTACAESGLFESVIEQHTLTKCRLFVGSRRSTFSGKIVAIRDKTLPYQNSFFVDPDHAYVSRTGPLKLSPDHK